MKTITTAKALRTYLAKRPTDKKIGLTPTMGNLHDGHLALVEAAIKRCDIVVASIFVNPAQFGPNEDFASYPRTLEADSKILNAAGVDVVFAPTVDEVYPQDPPGTPSQTVVSVSKLSQELCGASRPRHFDGVTTVVTKLFNMVQPHVAFFGEKDWQQLAMIRIMTRELNMPIEIVGVPTARDPDGLALSSRNQYLTEAERNKAPLLYQTLLDIRHAISNGARDFKSLEQTGRMALQRAGFEPEYIEVRDAQTLGRPDDASTALRVLGAAELGHARLIDNLDAKA